MGVKVSPILALFKIYAYELRPVGEEVQELSK